MKQPSDELILGVINWIEENGKEPYLEVTDHPDASVPKGVELPNRFRIGDNAVNNFNIRDGAVWFDATFNGKHHTVFIPTAAIVGIIAITDVDDRKVVEGLLHSPERASKATPEEKKEKPRMRLVGGDPTTEPSSS